MGQTFEPGVGGRLILWHGEPGTGKTYALRALGWEWRSGATSTTSPTRRRSSARARRTCSTSCSTTTTRTTTPSRWRLLILEDTGELLAADAKERTGQGLSRLLNVVDGLIGQGLQVLVLVTTNEPLRRLHPAVSRPGRCAVADRVRRAFTAERGGGLARAARAARRSLGGSARRTLASLFAGDDGRRRARRVGFTS